MWIIFAIKYYSSLLDGVGQYAVHFVLMQPELERTETGVNQIKNSSSIYTNSIACWRWKLMINTHFISYSVPLSCYHVFPAFCLKSKLCAR